MITLGFKNRYRVLHLSAEFGNAVIGGVTTHVNEQYRYRDAETGFLHYRDNLDFSLADYDEHQDIAVITNDDIERLIKLDFDILVVHYFGLAHLVTHELLQRRQLVYVVHSVPTPEPQPKWHAFGGHYQCETNVKSLCHYASAIINVSAAEQIKLNRIFPEYASKTGVIYNGLTIPDTIHVAPPRKSRLGFAARMDYRKGLIETLKAIRYLDVELHLACDNADRIYYLRRVNEYIYATGIANRLHWHGFCIGERKKAFFEYCDVVVMPSLYEPFCYVVIEPLAYGKPVIVANNGGSGEIVGPDYRYQYDPYSRDGYAEALRRFLEDPVERIVEETQHLVERLPLFDGRRMVENYRALLRAL